MTMMWLGFIAIAGLCGASFGQGYPPTPATYTKPAPNYQNPGGRPSVGDYSQNRYDNARTELNTLVKNLNNLEDCQAPRQRRTDILAESTGDDISFKNDFFNIFQKKINDEQYQQDSRLDDLAKKIAKLKSLKAQATEAWGKYVILRNITDKTEASDRKVLDTIHNLQACDEQDAIAAIRERVDIFDEIIDVTIWQVYNNSQIIYELELHLKQVFLYVNSQKSFGNVLNMNLDPDRSVHFINDFPAVPNQHWSSVAGYHFVIAKQKYQEGNLAIHFIVTVSNHKDKVFADAIDSSTVDQGTRVTSLDLICVAFD